jgi:hypothetical protein
MTFQNDFSKLDVDKILRRGDREFSSASKMLSEFFQVAVFFSHPVIEELDYLPDDKKEELIKKENFFTRKKLRDFLDTFPDLCNIEFSNQRFIFPFYSQEVFVTQTDAINFIPYFIKKLISDEKLPTNVINEDKSVNEDFVRTAIVPLQVVFLEKEKSEFKTI